VLFHGDFILDNIIKTADGFKLLDWRQDFGGSLISGDIYYDLAKLNHNLTVNHKIIDENNFEIIEKNNEVVCSIHLHSLLNECKEVLHNFIEKEGLDLKRIKILTAIIWLNMAPLHHYPFNRFLYYFGRYNLHKELMDASN
jgi:thiamine kinase-like enzyme